MFNQRIEELSLLHNVTWIHFLNTVNSFPGNFTLMYILSCNGAPMEKVKLNNLETCASIKILFFGKLMYVRDLTTSKKQNLNRCASFQIIQFYFFHRFNMGAPKNSLKCNFRETY